MRGKLLAVALLFLLPLPLEAVDVELAGSYFFAEPGDLNLSSGFCQGWFHFFREVLEWGQRAGVIENLRENREGDFSSVKGGFFLEGRVRFVLGKRFALGVGFSHVQLSASSSPSEEFSYYSPVRNSQDELSLSSGEKLRASSITPFLSLHFTFLRRSRVDAEVWVAAGYTFAEARAELSVSSSSSSSSGSWSRWSVNILQEGSAKGPALEAGTRLAWRLSSRLRLFAGLGYMRAKLSHLRGSGRYSMQASNSDGFSTSQDLSWDDEIWYVGKVQFGSKAFYVSTNMPDFLSSLLREAELDLSGLRFVLGLSLTI